MSKQARTILDRLYRHAEDTSDQLVYKFLNKGAPPDILSYRQLEQRVRTLAAQFSELRAFRRQSGDLLLQPKRSDCEPMSVPKSHVDPSALPATLFK